MNENEKAELIHAAGEDWNNITPFLIKEFLWRKQNGRSVKNLSEEIKAYEKLNELPQKELEKYLTSTAVNGNVTKVKFCSNNLSFNNFIQMLYHIPSFFSLFLKNCKPPITLF